MRSDMAHVKQWNGPFCLYSVSILQMAPPEQDSIHPITAYYSFVDVGRVKG